MAIDTSNTNGWLKVAASQEPEPTKPEGGPSYNRFVSVDIPVYSLLATGDRVEVGGIGEHIEALYDACEFAHNRAGEILLDYPHPWNQYLVRFTFSGIESSGTDTSYKVGSLSKYHNGFLPPSYRAEAGNLGDGNYVYVSLRREGETTEYLVNHQTLEGRRVTIAEIHVKKGYVVDYMEFPGEWGKVRGCSISRF